MLGLLSANASIVKAECSNNDLASYSNQRINAAIGSFNECMTNKLRAFIYGQQPENTKKSVTLKIRALVEDEWWLFKNASTGVGQQAAGWKLKFAIKRMRTLYKKHDGENQDLLSLLNYEEALERIGYSSNYSSRNILPTDDDWVIKETIRVHINSMISPSSRDEINNKIQQPIRQSFEVASQAMSKAVIVGNLAAGQARAIYGIPKGRDDSDWRQGKNVSDKLSSTEEAFFYPKDKENQLEEIGLLICDYFPSNCKEGDSSQSQSDSLLQKYAILRETLSFEKEEGINSISFEHEKWGLPPEKLDTFFSSTVRNTTLINKLIDLEGNKNLKVYADEAGVDETLKVYVDSKNKSTDPAKPIDNNKLEPRLKKCFTTLDKNNKNNKNIIPDQWKVKFKTLYESCGEPNSTTCPEALAHPFSDKQVSFINSVITQLKGIPNFDQNIKLKSVNTPSGSSSAGSSEDSQKHVSNETEVECI